MLNSDLVNDYFKLTGWPSGSCLSNLVIDAPGGDVAPIDAGAGRDAQNEQPAPVLGDNLKDSIFNQNTTWPKKHTVGQILSQVGEKPNLA